MNGVARTCRFAAPILGVLLVFGNAPLHAQGMRWPVSPDPSLNPTFPIARCPAGRECDIEKVPLELAPPMNTMCTEYQVSKRTPVYKVPSASDPPFFYLPRNSRVCIEGKVTGWGIFSRYIPERFKQLLLQATPDDNMQYGWVALEGMTESTDDGGRPCISLPPNSTNHDYFSCTGGFDNASAQSVITFVVGYSYKGDTYQRLIEATLNACLKTCRDDARCVGFTYSGGTCLSASSGGVHYNFRESAPSSERQEGELESLVSGVKLVHSK